MERRSRRSLRAHVVGLHPLLSYSPCFSPCCSLCRHCTRDCTDKQEYRPKRHRITHRVACGTHGVARIFGRETSHAPGGDGGVNSASSRRETLSSLRLLPSSAALLDYVHYYGHIPSDRSAGVIRGARVQFRTVRTPSYKMRMTMIERTMSGRFPPDVLPGLSTSATVTGHGLDSARFER